MDEYVDQGRRAIQISLWTDLLPPINPQAGMN